MSLLGGGKRLGDPYVQLLVADLEPDPSARPKRLRLGQLGQAEEVAVEVSSLLLAAAGSGDLYVVDTQYRHAHTPYWWPEPYATRPRVGQETLLLAPAREDSLPATTLPAPLGLILDRRTIGG